MQTRRKKKTYNLTFNQNQFELNKIPRKGRTLKKKLKKRHMEANILKIGRKKIIQPTHINRYKNKLTFIQIKIKQKYETKHPPKKIQL